LSDQDIKDLVELDPEKFEHQEWVALAWARDWASSRGKVTDPEILQEFESLYTEQERRDILAVVTLMNFANTWNNTFTRRVLKEEDVGKRKK
jgi:hypothetical protein